MAYYQIKLRNDTAADWTTANPTLSLGEMGYETDSGKMKIGDGSTRWTSLSYFDPSGTGALKYHKLISGGSHTDTTYGPAFKTGDIIIRSSTGYWKRLGIPDSSYHYLRAAPTMTDKIEWTTITAATTSSTQHNLSATWLTNFSTSGAHDHIHSATWLTNTVNIPPHSLSATWLTGAEKSHNLAATWLTSFSVSGAHDHTHAATWLLWNTTLAASFLSGQNTMPQRALSATWLTGAEKQHNLAASWLTNFSTSGAKDHTHSSTWLTNFSTSGAHDHSHGATWIDLDTLTYWPSMGAPTFNDEKDLWDTTGSSGRIIGGHLTATAAGGVAFSALKGVIKTSDSEQGGNKFFTVPAGSLTAGSLTDNSINYIYCDYNSGAPTVLCTTSRDTIKWTNQFNLGRAYKRGTTTEVVTSGICLTNFKRRNHEMMVGVLGYARASGGDITQSGTTFLAASAGVFYIGSNKNTTSAIDTAGTDTFYEWYRTSGGAAWTQLTGRTCIDNTNYDKTGTGITPLTVNKYGVHWVYLCYAGHINVVLGQGDYSLNDALAAQRPSSLPDYLSKFAILAAKIIIKKSATTFTQVTSAYETLFPMASVPEHNGLTGLQGGNPAGEEYHHLSAATHTRLIGFGSLPAKALAATWLTGFPTSGAHDHTHASTWLLWNNTLAASFLSGQNTMPQRALSATWLTGAEKSHNLGASWLTGFSTSGAKDHTHSASWINGTYRSQALGATWLTGFSASGAHDHTHAATWITQYATLFDAKGDIITACAADTPYRTAVGANYCVLAASSTKAGGVSWVRQKGSMWFSAGAAIGRTTNPAMDQAPSETGGRKVMIPFMAFDKGTAEYCQWLTAAPTDWDATPIKAQVVSTFDTSTSNKVSRWGLTGLCYSDNDVIGGGKVAWGATQYVLVNGNAQWTWRSSTYLTLTLGGTMAAGSYWVLQLHRDAANSLDTLDRDGLMIGVKVEYNRRT